MNITSREPPRIDYPAPDPAKPYVYPGTPVLINLFDIRSGAVLDRVVTAIASLRGAQLHADSLSGEFDLAHLCAFHHALFQDVFAWAGQVRTVDTEKGGQDFLPAADVPAEFRRIHEELKCEDFLRGLGLKTFADRLADYYYRIYLVHAFRDGNSRALRHFCAALAATAGYRLDFAAIDRELLLTACRQRYFNKGGGSLRDCLRQVTFPA